MPVESRQLQFNAAVRLMLIYCMTFNNAQDMHVCVRHEVQQLFWQVLRLVPPGHVGRVCLVPPSPRSLLLFPLLFLLLLSLLSLLFLHFLLY
eukprot:COSAG01_NODE_730_length_14022_cov_127.417511_7_plen_92_part_00